MSTGMINVTIDGKSIEVRPDTTILEAAGELDINIPTLCHSEIVESYGACRLCLVEISERGKTKLVTSCN